MRFSWTSFTLRGYLFSTPLVTADGVLGFAVNLCSLTTYSIAARSKPESSSSDARSSQSGSSMSADRRQAVR
jgi:hypothetical protein